MIYVITEPRPVRKQQLTEQQPTYTVPALPVSMFGRDRLRISARFRKKPA
jgi:hypothetical protein